MFELRQVPYLLDLSLITCKLGIVFVFVYLGSFILVSVFYILKVFLGNLMIAFWIHVCEGCRGRGELQNGVKRQRTEFFIEGNSNVSLCLISWAISQERNPLISCLGGYKSSSQNLRSAVVRESFPRQVDKKSRGPEEQSGLEFLRRKKGQTFFPLYIP